MPRPQLSPDLIEAIKGAPLSQTAESVAQRLGVSPPSVKKYRREARRARQEAAHGIIAEQVEANIPDALSDLSDLRQRARAAYVAGADPRDGTLWLKAIEATLKHVTPDDAELDRLLDAEVARLSGREAVNGS